MIHVDDLVRAILLVADDDRANGEIFIATDGVPHLLVRFWKSSKFIAGSFRNGWHPPHPSFFVKRTVYQNFGNFDVSLPVSAEFELMLRFMEVHKSVAVYVPQILTRMRVGGHSQSFGNIIKGGKSILHSFEKNGIKVQPFFYFSKRYFSKLKQVLFSRNTIIKEISFRG